MMKQMQDDLAGFSEKSLTVGSVKKISDLANRQLRIEDEIRGLEEELGKWNADLTEVSQRLLPDALAEAGVSEVKLEDGSKVTVKKIYAAALGPENKEQAFGWLRENGHEALISHAIEIKLRKDDPETYKKVAAFLAKGKVDHSDTEKVHPQTLQAFIREQVEAGKPFPLDLFKVAIINQAKIKAKN